jgi:hypothetical protein
MPKTLFVTAEHDTKQCSPVAVVLLKAVNVLFEMQRLTGMLLSVLKTNVNSLVVTVCVGIKIVKKM